mgnify:CR=1 FL=1
MATPGALRLFRWLNGRSPRGVLVASLVGLVAVGVVDEVTGVEIRVFPLYFVPVALVGWRFGTSATLGMSVGATAVWVFANVLGGRSYSMSYIWAINAGVQFLSFALVGLLISWMRELLADVDALSRRDALTGLLNSRAFEEVGRALLATARRDRRPLTIAFLDLDNFKCVNDRHGHGRGDDLLRDVASALRGAVRESDVVARLGGDEFAVLLPDTDEDGARVLMARVHAAVRGAVAGVDCAVSASIGAVAFAEVPDGLDAALRAADELMYEVKRGGKDAVRVTTAAPRAP